MKKVTFENKDTVSIENISNSSVIGLIHEDEKYQIILSKAGFCASKDTDFSQRDCMTSMYSYLKRTAKDSPEAEIFVFDTPKELFKWLSE